MNIVTVCMRDILTKYPGKDKQAASTFATSNDAQKPVNAVLKSTNTQSENIKKQKRFVGLRVVS